MDRFLGFYLEDPFWALQKLDVDSLQINSTLFTASMSEIVFIHDTPKYSLKICRDGRFLLRITEISDKIAKVGGVIQKFGEHLESWSEYLMFANALTLIFQSEHLEKTSFGYFNPHELTNKDAFGVMFENGQETGNSISTQSVAEKYQMGRYLSQYPNNGVPLSVDSRFSRRIVVEKAIFESTVKKFDSIFEQKASISNLNQMIKSVSEYKVGNFDTSLILSWFVVESIIHSKWSAWIDSKNMEIAGSQRINSERKATLNGRDYTMSSKLNMLELANVLPYSTFKDLDRVRTFRNKIVHQDERYDCSLDDAGLSLKAATSLILQQFGVDLKINLGLSISGL